MIPWLMIIISIVNIIFGISNHKNNVKNGWIVACVAWFIIILLEIKILIMGG